MKKHHNKSLSFFFIISIIVIAIFFVGDAMRIQQKATLQETKFHELQLQYWSLEKTIRDSAETDSELNQDLGIIKNYPSELLRLQLAGLGRIMTGIFILLLGIFIVLILLPNRLSSIRKGKK